MTISHELRQGHRFRLMASAVVAVVIAGMVGTVLVRSWLSADRQAGAAALERRGIAYLQPAIHLVALLAAGEVNVARGAAVNTEPLQTALADVDAADASGLGAATRWADLRQRVTGLIQHPGTGPVAVEGWTDAAGLANALVSAVATNGGLDLDPDADSFELLQAAARTLPGVIVYAGRAGDIAASIGVKSLSAAEQATLDVAVYQVALTTKQLDSQLAGAITAESTTTADLTSQEDAFESAVSNFAPSGVVSTLTGQVNVVGLPLAAQAVQSSALALADQLFGRADALVASRARTLDDDEAIAVFVGVAFLLCSAALGWLLVPLPRRAPQHAETGSGDRDGRLIQAGDLIDARDLPLEELVHIGRGVRVESAARVGRNDAK